MADRQTEAERIASLPQNRLPREADTRQARPTSWAPPDLLPSPVPQEGFTYRWVRVSTLGVSDPTNVSRQFREGYEPVRAEDHPELFVAADPNSRFKGNVEVGGLLLCKVPTEIVRQRAQHYDALAQQQQQAADNNFMRESDPRMPLFKERSSRTSFGNG